MSEVQQSQIRHDKKRSQKLSKLLRTKKTNKTNLIKVFNFTENTKIPKHIINTITAGPVGGRPDRLKILENCEKVIEKWTKYASSLSIDPIRVWQTKTSLMNTFAQFFTCFQKNGLKNSKLFSKQKQLTVYLVKVDKSKHCIDG